MALIVRFLFVYWQDHCTDTSSLWWYDQLTVTEQQNKKKYRKEIDAMRCMFTDARCWRPFVLGCTIAAHDSAISGSCNRFDDTWRLIVVYMRQWFVGTMRSRAQNRSKMEKSRSIVDSTVMYMCKPVVVRFGWTSEEHRLNTFINSAKSW